MDSFIGKVAVITGGASGIGLACARGFAQAGCRVGLWDLSTQVVSVAGKITDDFGEKSLGLNVDVSDFTAVQAALEETESKLGPV